MQIAVTGASGELGRSLVPFLLAQGHAVVSLDRALTSASFVTSAHTAREVLTDMTDFGQVVAGLRECDAVIHLAAHRSPVNAPDPVVYHENTASSYNVLSAASALGIRRVCLASSINAIGGVFSRWPRYDYFPLDEQHPSYAEDPYALSKWVLEQQADAFARRYDWLAIASLRFHWLSESRADVATKSQALSEVAIKHLWGYVRLSEACRACLLAVTAPFSGHAALYIAAPRTVAEQPSLELARQYYPNTPIRGELAGHAGFFNCARAERVLGWRHEDE
jgi:nucleoside-diphosphate-sugar epimerase